MPFIDDELQHRLVEAGAHNDLKYHVLEAVDRFQELHAPKKLPDPVRDEDKLRQIIARLPESTIAEADRIGELLSYSRNEVIIKAVQFYCESVSSELRDYASAVAHQRGDATLLDVVDRQLDIFQGE